MNFKDLKQLCLSHGFTNVVPLACDTIELKPEVRQMCASDSCHKYNKCWSCDPNHGLWFFHGARQRKEEGK